MSEMHGRYSERVTFEEALQRCTELGLRLERTEAELVSCLEELELERTKLAQQQELLTRARRVLGCTGEPANRHPVNVNAYQQGQVLGHEIAVLELNGWRPA